MKKNLKRYHYLGKKYNTFHFGEKRQQQNENFENTCIKTRIIQSTCMPKKVTFPLISLVLLLIYLCPIYFTAGCASPVKHFTVFLFLISFSFFLSITQID